MSTYQKCPGEVIELASTVMCKFEDHKPILDHRVRIDFMFAYAEENEKGELCGSAITHDGIQALGLCKKMGPKERCKGMGDVEILLDGNWWQGASEGEKEALLDHELYHISVSADKDDLGRPKIKMRKHDFQFGWFTRVAARHAESIERQQAREIMEHAGQFFCPGILFESEPK
jgi:hypothetical protein